MYTIEMTTKCVMTEKQKDTLVQAVKEADAQAECKVADTSCLISCGGADMETLSYFMGVIMGCNSSAQIVKLQLLYEKQQ